MKCVIALAMLLLTISTSSADANVNRFRMENGKIIVAQSYCAMCADSAGPRQRIASR